MHASKVFPWLACLAMAALPLGAQAQWLFGRLTPGPGLEPNHESEAVSVSNDGRTFVFSSAATNWNATAGVAADKAIVVDALTGLIEVASLTTAGTVVRGEAPVASADGRYVAFLTYGSDLGVGVPTPNWQVVRRDRSAGVLQLVSANPAGDAAGAHVNDDYVAISGDGRYIAFEASSANLGITSNGYYQVFVKDMVTGQLKVASLDQAGVPAASGCSIGSHALSGDGRFVVMICGTAPTSNGPAGQAWVRDLNTGQIELVSRASGANGGASTAFALRAAISPNGRFVSFQNRCYGGLGTIGGQCNNNSGIYVRDRQTQTTTALPRPAMAEYDSCGLSDISDLGTVLMTCTMAGKGQVFLHVPGAAGTPFLISEGAGTGVPGNGSSGASVAVDASGRAMAFSSSATDLVTGDANGRGDIFVLIDQNLIDGLFSDGFEE